MGREKEGWLWASGETWASQLLLVAVEGLDQGAWGLGLIYWLVVTRPLATVLPAPARSGTVLQEPALRSVLQEASGSQQPLHSQVPLLAKGWQLLACQGKQETGLYRKARGEE